MRIKFTDTLWFYFLLGLLATAIIWFTVLVPWPANADDEQDLRIPLTLAIAHEYGLTRDQAILLLAIGKHELTPREQMKTYGYFGIRKSDKPILYKCKTDKTLFILSAILCAETILKHCPMVTDAAIRKFGKRYAEDPGWAVDVINEEKAFSNILY